MPHDETDKEFEARMDMESLKRAQEISSDPQRSKAAKTALDKELNTLNKLSGSTLITSGKSDKKTLVT